MEGEELVVFDEKAFKTQWEENGMGNESMWKFFGRSYGQIVDTILRPMAEQVRADRGLSGLSISLPPFLFFLFPFQGFDPGFGREVGSVFGQGLGLYSVPDWQRKLPVHV